MQKLGTLVLDLLESTHDLPRIKKTTFSNGNFMLSQIYLDGSRSTFEACYTPSGEMISCHREHSCRIYDCNETQIRQLAAKGDLWAKQ